MFYFKGKKPDIFRFASLSFTALTACSFYAQDKVWVIAEDWGALADTVSTVSGALWIFVLVSIIVNGSSLLKKK